MHRLECHRTETLWGDRQSANSLTAETVSRDGSKRRHVGARGFVRLEETAVKWIGTKVRLTDGSTEALPRTAPADLNKLQQN